MHDCRIYDDGVTLIMEGSDPQLYLDVSKVAGTDSVTINLESIEIYIENPPVEDWGLQIFYSKDRNQDQFNEYESYSELISGGEKVASLNCKENEVYSIRIDMDLKTDEPVTVSKIKINRSYWGQLVATSFLGWMVFFSLFLYILFSLFSSVSKINRVKKTLCFISFSLLLSLSMMWKDFNIKGALTQVSMDEKKYSFSESTDVINKSIDDNIGWKSLARNIRLLMTYKLMGYSPVYQVELGKDDWLFYTLENNIEIATGNYPMTEADYKATALAAQNLKDILSDNNSNFVFLSPCSKTDIYPEYLLGNIQADVTPTDQLYQAFQTYTNVDFIYLKEILLREKEDQLLYYKKDTHWNHAGMAVGYRRIYDCLKNMGQISNDLPEWAVKEIPYSGDLARMLGNERIVGYDSYSFFDVVNDNYIYVRSGNEFDKLAEICGENNVPLKDCSIYQNPNLSDGKRLLFCGDSFFLGDSFTRTLFAENFSEVVFIWSYNISPEMLEAFQPDLVILEMGERALIEAERVMTDSANRFGTAEK